MQFSPTDLILARWNTSAKLAFSRSPTAPAYREIGDLLMERINNIRKYRLGEGSLLYVPNWADDPDMLCREARKLSFTPEIISQYGKQVTIKKRLTVDYGLTYAYNTTAKASIEWEPLPLAIKQKLELQLARTFQQCAGNHYLDPKGYISAHSDKSTPVSDVLCAPNLIISLSLSSLRQMALRPIVPGHEGDDRNQLVTMADVRRCKDVIVLDLEPGSLVIFDGVFNHTWKHAIPQAEGSNVVGDRISLTYREF
jgi:alkylated DNA repair dioxygenase AlkB